ncbi:MAG: UDP-3-O-(3-hydroxymyristoyl)glucosamine N-acyltransferase [Oligoflexia bacterium]|nr:UDP-3-O-(3-hydroxymyristoyl)glucosamine N-acyltransferase [Oligoflexia bacterium]MBF0366006.1 UDP-3-O-(3-hydroxymyristoyl)glucosamine N-acyltransferase [Oligoflexia bacterium]
MDLRTLIAYEPSLKPFDDHFGSDFDTLTTADVAQARALFFIKDQKYLTRWQAQSDHEHWRSCGAILSESLATKIDLQLFSGKVLLVATVSNVDLAISNLSYPFYQKKMQGVNLFRDGRASGTAEVAASAMIADRVFIGEHSFIGENVAIMAGAMIGPYVRIEDNSMIASNVSIYPWVKIAKGCRIHSGTVIGADGFGYNFDGREHRKVWHMGGVEIASGVEIGANSAVDAGAFAPTTIGSGTKIDNHVQIGHNCKIGKGVIICGQAGISGSAVIGDYTVFGGRAGCGPNVVIGSQCQVAGGAMINCDWPDKSVLGGHPARPLSEWMRGLAFIRRESLKGEKQKNEAS